MKHLLLVPWTLALLAASAAGADLQLATPFTDHMVLQRDLPVPIWGTAKAGEKISVEFAGQTKTATAEASGQWVVKLDPLKANATPAVLTVHGPEAVVLKDVLVGEVWLCAGQSNMEVGLERIKTTKFVSNDLQKFANKLVNEELATTTPGLRLFRSGPAKSNPRYSQWLECNPASLSNFEGKQGFSAVAYFFGKELQKELNVPVGLIEAAVGGTRIEPWTPPAAYVALPAFQKEAATTPVTIDGQAAGKLFSTYINPLVPFALRGVCWYQGESNVIACDRGPRYADKMEALIQGWRSAWKQAVLPFYYVQLPPMAYTKRHRPPDLTTQALPQLREGQALALRVPQTGMIVTTDLAEAYDLHPTNKWDVGHRLALLALAQTYNRKDLVFSGPVYKSMEVQGDKIVLSFDHVAGGLVSKNGKALNNFLVAGADQAFVPAVAVIENGKVVVSHPAGTPPVAVRFAWEEESRPNFFNQAGLPAAPFRTDHWPLPEIRVGSPAAEEANPAAVP